MQGSSSSSSYSGWGGFNSPLLLQQQAQQLHAGVQLPRFNTPPAAAVPAAYGSMDASLDPYGASSSISHSPNSAASPYSLSPATSHNGLALLGGAVSGQPMPPATMNVVTAAVPAAAVAAAAFPVNAGSQLPSISGGMQVPLLGANGQLSSNSAGCGMQIAAVGQQALGVVDYGNPADVSLMDWLLLQQQLQQHEAAGITAAAAAAGSPSDQPWMACVGIAAAPASNMGYAEQPAALLSTGLGLPVLDAATAAAVPAPLPPPAPPPPPVRAPAADDAMLLGTQTQRQQQQQQMTVELEPHAWASIAEKDGWRDVALLSGAQIEVQVQASSRLLALQVSGTAAQVDMVSKLVCLLLQQPWRHELQQCVLDALRIAPAAGCNS
jgi:hypothetical protein